MKSFEMKLQKNGIRVVVKNYTAGYLATVDKLDKDEDVEYGCTGNFSSNINNAVQNALALFVNTFIKEMIA